MKPQRAPQALRHALAFVLAAVVIMVMVAPVAPVSAESNPNPNPGVLEPNSTPYGHTYDEWNNMWWQWVMGQSVDPVHPDQWPLFDATGEHCSSGQSGPVWFLAGSWVGTVDRTECVVPEGKALFFPIVNIFCDETPTACGTEYKEYVAGLKSTIDHAANLTAEVDGTSFVGLRHYRALSPDLYLETLPENNIYQYLGGDIPAGTYHAAAGGYYLMLAPLSKGQHTIHFYGEIPGSAQDITYHLTVR